MSPPRSRVSKKMAAARGPSLPAGANAPAGARSRSGAAPPARNSRPTGQNAATQAVQGHATGLDLPAIGHLDLPPKGSLAYYGAIALMAGLGLLEWPVAVAIAAGHFLAQQHGNRVLEDFGKGMEDA